MNKKEAEEELDKEEKEEKEGGRRRPGGPEGTSAGRLWRNRENKGRVW